MVRGSTAPGGDAVYRAMKAVREAKRPKVTQDDLAALVGIRQQLISRWEGGNPAMEPRPSEIYLIETALAVPYGTVLRKAGMVTDAVTVEDAILLDPGLDDVAKGTLIGAYRGALFIVANPGGS